MEQVQVSSKPFWDRHWVRYGLAGGGAAILITILLYLLDEGLLMQQWVGMVPLAAILAAGIMAPIAVKKDNGGYLTYGQTVLASLGAFVTGLVLHTVFNVLLFLVIDPTLTDKLRDMQISKLEEQLDAGKMSQAQYDMAADWMSNMSSNMFLFNMLLGVLLLAVGGLIIFLITSIFIRNEPQV